MAQEPDQWRVPVDDAVDGPDAVAPEAGADRSAGTPDADPAVAAWSPNADEDELATPWGADGPTTPRDEAGPAAASDQPSRMRSATRATPPPADGTDGTDDRTGDDSDDEVFSFALGGSDHEQVESTRFGLRTTALADGARDELDAMAAADALAALEAVPTSPTPGATRGWTGAGSEHVASADDGTLDDHLAWALDKARETEPPRAATATPAPDRAAPASEDDDEPATFTVPALDDDATADAPDDDSPESVTAGVEPGPPADEPAPSVPPAASAPAAAPPAAPPPSSPPPDADVARAPAGAEPTPPGAGPTDAPAQPLATASDPGEPDEIADAGEEHDEQRTPAEDSQASADEPRSSAAARPGPLASIWGVADDAGRSAWDAYAAGELEGRAAAWDEATVRPGGLPEDDWDALATAGSGEVDGAAWATLEAEATPEAPDDDDWESAADTDAWPDHGTLTPSPAPVEEVADTAVEAFLVEVTDDDRAGTPASPPLADAGDDVLGPTPGDDESGDDESGDDEDDLDATWSLDTSVDEAAGDDDLAVTWSLGGEPSQTAGEEDLDAAWSLGTYTDDGLDDEDLDAAWERASATSPAGDGAPSAPSEDEPIDGLDDDLVFSFSVDDLDEYADDVDEPTGDLDTPADDRAATAPSDAPGTGVTDDDFSALLEATAAPSALAAAAHAVAETADRPDTAPDGSDAAEPPTPDDDHVEDDLSVGALAHLDALDDLDDLDGLGDLDLDWLDGEPAVGTPTPPPPPTTGPPPPPPPPTPGTPSPAAADAAGREDDTLFGEPTDGDDEVTIDDDAEPVASAPGSVDLGNFSAGRAGGGRRKRGLFGR